MFNSVAFCCNMTCITVSVVVIVFCYCCNYTIKRGKLQEKKLLLLLLALSMSTTLLSSATIVKNCEQGRNSRHFSKGLYTVVSLDIVGSLYLDELVYIVMPKGLTKSYGFSVSL